MKHLKTQDYDKSYIAIADFLRVSAILLISWYHFWQQSWLDPSFYIGQVHINLWELVSSGYMMVDVLLVLSGYLIALPYAREYQDGIKRTSIKEFYRKRIRRILPSYLFAILIILLCYVGPKDLYEDSKDAVVDLVAHLTFTHNLSPQTYFLSPLPGVLWTLAVEVQFYILFPFVGIAYSKRPLGVCFVLALLAVCFRALVYQMADTTFWVNQLPCMLDLYACGMLAALFSVKASRMAMADWQKWLMTLTAILCFWGILKIVYIQDTTDYEILRHGQLLWRLPIGVLTGGILLCGGLIPIALQKLVGNRMTRFLAAISYNYYIWHQFLACRLKEWRIPNYVSDTPNVVGEQPWQLQYTIACFVVGIVVACGITYTIEKPCSRIGRDWKSVLEVKTRQ